MSTLKLNRGSLGGSPKPATSRRGKKQVDMGSLKKATSVSMRGNAFKTQNVGLQVKSDAFWGDDGLDHLGYHEESVNSLGHIGQATTSEQILAGRIRETGADAAAAMRSQIRKAQGLAGLDYTGFAKSQNPAEKLAYMAGTAGLNLQKVYDALGSSGHWGNPNEEGSEEASFEQLLAEARKEEAGLKSPLHRGMAVMGAMTMSSEKYKQSIDAPDLITPDSNDKWLQKSRDAMSAFGTLAGAYIDNSKFSSPEARKAMHLRVAGALSRTIPQRVSDTGLAMVQRGVGRKPIGWTQAMPSVQQIAKMLPKSDRDFLVSKINKQWTDDGKGGLSSPFTGAIKAIRTGYSRYDEGALRRPRNFESREAAYMRDELAREGIDPSQTVISVNADRDQMYEFKVTNDVSEAVTDAMRDLALTPADLIGDQSARNAVKALAMGKGSGSATRDLAQRHVARVATHLPPPDATYRYAPTVPPRERRGGHAGSSVRNEPAGAVPEVGAPAKTAQAAKAEQRLAGGNPALAKARWYRDSPHLSHIADDDDKTDPNSLWARSRRGKVTSSAAYGLSNAVGDKEYAKTYKALFEGAATPLSEKMDPKRGTLWTDSGDALEPLALDWYRRHVDPDTFEPGMMTNANKPGQATTPDGISPRGRRLVEVKSRNSFIDPDNIDTSTQAGKAAAATLRKNYIQMQHQMYLTGASTTDLVEILRDQENPNLPRGRGGLDDSNIRRRTVDRDDEMINRMAPTWDAAGRAADAISKQPDHIQKAFAKAVEEGNIKSFEKLSAKHGISGADALAASMGMGGSGGGGGGDGWYSRYNNSRFTGRFGGPDGPSTFRGGMRSALSLSRPGMGVNALMSVAESLWSGANDINNVGLGLSANARSSGLSIGMFQGMRNSMAQGRYLSMEDAASDVNSAMLAKGGLQLGFTDRAKQMVIGSRGAITLGDIQNLDVSDMDSVRNLMSQTERRLRQRGVKTEGIAAVMEQTGLKGILDASDVSAGQKSTNDAIVATKTAVEDMKQGMSTAVGSLRRIVDGVEYIAGKFGFKSSNDAGPTTPTPTSSGIPAGGGFKSAAHEEQWLDAMAKTESGALGSKATSKAGAIGKYQIMPDTARMWGYEPEDMRDDKKAREVARKIMYRNLKLFGGNLEHATMAYNAGEGRIQRWLKGEGKPLTKETQDYFGKVSGHYNDLARTASTSDAWRGNDIGYMQDRAYRSMTATPASNIKVDVNLTTTGTEVNIKDADGRVTSKAYKPHDRGNARK